MSDFKKIMGAINGSSAPRQIMTLLESGTGDRTSTLYEKYAPKSRIIISISGQSEPTPIAESKPPETPAEGTKPATKAPPVKDVFDVVVEALLPDGVYHPIAEFSHQGNGTSELVVTDIPADWRLSVTTKSKHSYSVFGY
jgi:hypothetical protein